MFDFDFFDDLFIFGKPYNLKFNAGETYDMHPVRWKKFSEDEGEKAKSGYEAICRTVGIGADDITVELNNDGIIVLDGKTELKGKEYSQHFEIPVDKSIIDKIDKITYETCNGLTFVRVYIKTLEKEKIKIEKI